MFNPVSSTAVRLALVPGDKLSSTFVPGQIVSATVASRTESGALLDIAGRRLDVILPDGITTGMRLSLRILSVGVTEVSTQLLETLPPLDLAAEQEHDVVMEPPSVVQVVRRFVDAAATRLFGSPQDAEGLDDMPDMQRVVSTRGDLPSGALLKLDPISMRSSAALSSATSEELLAAQAALERLDVPATPITVAAALPDANDPVRLAAVLARLDTALISLSREGRVATLRTLAAFLSQISPDEEEAAAQLSAFVDQVAIGSESKFVALLTALEQRALAAPDQRAVLTARATERATSLTHDLKTQLLSLISTRADDTELAPLLTEALEALTAAQLTSLNAARELPGALAFVLPVATPGGTLPAQITVQRDAPDGEKRRPLDARNFRISFVIETRRLGTVHVRLEAIGGAMRLAMEAETTRAADRLREKLDDLSAAVSKRGFRVVAISSTVGLKTGRKDAGNRRTAYIPTVRGTTERREFIHVDTRA